MRVDPLLKPSLLCLLSMTLALPVGMARAADYDPPLVVDQAPEYVPVEVGSAWYLRGDVGAAVNDVYRHSEEDNFSIDRHSFTGSIGVGYHWTDFFRSELNLGILPSSKFSDESVTSCVGMETTTVTTNFGIGVRNIESTRPCKGTDEASNRSYSLFADGYFDLGTYAGLTPYIGGGVGAVYTKHRAARGARDCQDSITGPTTAGGTTTTVEFNCYDDEFYEGSVTSEGDYNFAYDLGAGLSYRVSTNGSIDLGYQYVNVPDAVTVSYDGGNFVYDKGIDVHSVKIGFRYDTW